MKIIAISPKGKYSGEAELINNLFDAGLERYHLYKTNASEQTMAEILERVSTSNLRRISIHSHFHLILAYGVGGIHYSNSMKKHLRSDFVSKVSLYQEFGTQVSVSISSPDEPFEPANYAILNNISIAGSIPPNIYVLTADSEKNSRFRNIAFDISHGNQKDPMITFFKLKTLSEKSFKDNP